MAALVLAGALVLPGAASAAAGATTSTTTTATASAATTVSYRSPWSVTQVQTWSVDADGVAPGGDGTYRLGAGGHVSAPIAYTAVAADVRVALEAGGFVVADLAGGPDGLSPFLGSTRFTVTFAVDPGAPLAVSDNQTWLAYTNGPGLIQTDCVWCMDVTRPSGTPNGGALIFVHGGGLTSGRRDNPVVAEYLSRFSALGYVTVSANYRLTSFGRGFGACDLDSNPPAGSACADWIATADKAGADLQAATDYLATHAGDWGIDPRAIAVAGGSSGGTVAAMAAWRAPGPGERRPGAAVSIAGAGRNALITRSAAPLMYAVYTHDPGYQLVGMDNFEKGRDAVGRARAAGAVVELRAYPGQGHVPEPDLGTYPGAKDTRAEATDLIAYGAAFFQRQLFGAAAAPPAQLLGQARTTVTSRPTAFQTLFTAATETRRWIPGDFNGDGRTDLLSYGSGAAFDLVWFARADGTWFDPIEGTTGSPPVFTPFVNQPGSYRGAVVGDVDGNGKDDVLFWGNGVQLWRFGLRLDGRPVISTPAAPPSSLDVPFVADVDGDGRKDVLWYGAGGLPDALRYGNADGTFTDAGPIGDPGGLAAVPTIGDLDGDHRDDVFWKVPGGANRIWYGSADRSAPFLDVTGPGLDTTGTGDVVTAADVDGDGRKELFVYGYGSRPDSVWRVAARGDAAPTRTAVNAWGWYTPLVGDLDGDGRQDLLFFAAGTATASLWYGNATGTFTQVNVAVGNQAKAPVLGRVDGVAGTATWARTDLSWPSP